MPGEHDIPCVCCFKKVSISIETWNKCEAPYAICKRCAKEVSHVVGRTLYMMRSQIMTLTQDQASIKKDIRNLYSAQQDVEQALMAQ